MNKRQVSARRFCPPSTVLFHCCLRTFHLHYISAYQGLIFVPFFYLPFFVLLKVTFCVIITVSQSKGSTVFCKLELHVLRQDNLD